MTYATAVRGYGFATAGRKILEIGEEKQMALSKDDCYFIASALLSMARICARETEKSKRRNRISMNRKIEAEANIFRLKRLAQEILSNEHW